MNRKRRRRSALPWLASAAVLAALIWVLLANVVFVVRDVRVSGAGEVPEADVRRLSGIRLGTRMAALDAAEVRKDVESDGRIAFVGLEKQLPSRVVLTVRPRSMDALIMLGGKILVLDSDAYVISTVERLPEKTIPYVTGIKAAYYTVGRQLDVADGRCMAMKAVLEAMKDQGATGYVSELSVADTADLRAITRTGITVLLGDAEDMPAKVAWMAGALADLEARGESGGQLDVSSATKADYRPAAAGEPAESEPEEVETQEQTEVGEYETAVSQMTQGSAPES